MKRLVLILTIVLLYVLAFEVAGFSSSAQAQTGTHTHEVGTAPDRSFKDIWNRDKLTGDWGGLRTDLADHGIDIGIRLSQFGQWVADGGVDTTGRYGGKVDYRLNIDASKLFGLWKGFYLSMHAETRFGHDVNAQAGAFALPNTPMLYPKARWLQRYGCHRAYGHPDAIRRARCGTLREGACGGPGDHSYSPRSRTGRKVSGTSTPWSRPCPGSAL